jgi:hypothetical protein
VYCGRVDYRALGDDQKSCVRLRGIVDDERLIDSVGAAREQQRAVGCESVAQRGLHIAIVAAGVDLLCISTAVGKARASHGYQQ